MSASFFFLPLKTDIFLDAYLATGLPPLAQPALAADHNSPRCLKRGSKHQFLSGMAKSFARFMATEGPESYF
jgi:hypothetical protein